MRTKQPLIKKDINNIIDLLSENILVKVVTPIKSGALILPQELSKHYRVVVYNNQKNVEQWYQNNPSDLIILYSIGSLNTIRLLSVWKENSRKILIVTNWNINIFPLAPTYYVERFIEPIAEVRYVSEKTDVNKLVQESSTDGNIVIYGDYKINKDNVYILDKPKYVSNVSMIIDSMKQQTNSTTITGGFRKPINYTSKQLADFRTKIGTENKVIYRLISEEKFNELPEKIPLEITLIPLHYTIIDLYKLKLNPNKVLEDVFSQSEINFTIEVMIKNDLLDLNNKLTQKAELIRTLPYGLRLSILLADWIEEYGIETAYAVVVLVTMIDEYNGTTPYEFLENVNNKPVFDFEIEYQAHIKKYFDRFRGKSDVETYLNIWDTMLTEREEKELKTDKWSELNYINPEYLENVNHIVNRVSNDLKIKRNSFDVTEINNKLEPLFNKIYPDKLYNLNTEDTINAKYNGFSIDTLSINSIEEERPLSLYALITEQIDSEYSQVKNVSISYVGNVDNQLFIESDITY